MRQIACTAVVAALLGAALPGAAEDAQDEVTLSLTCKGPMKGRGRSSILRFDGNGPLPDNAVLKVRVQPLVEQWAVDRLATVKLGEGGSLSQVRNRKFGIELSVDGPGLYSVTVELLDEFQNPQLMQSMKGKYKPRTWTYQFHAWDDKMVEQLWPKLQELDGLIAEAQAMLRKFELACQTEQSWQAQAKALTQENGKLLQELERAKELRAFFPAALNQAYYTIRNVQGTANYFVWKAGQFAGGKSYHADNEEVKTFRNEAFTYANLRRYVEESLNIAGREFCLWILKDARRAGEVRPEAVAAVQSAKAHAGVAEFAAQLEALKMEEIDVLEPAVRRAKTTPPPPDPKGNDKPQGQ